MKRIVFVVALMLTSNVVLTSCREESKIEQAADDVGDAAEDVADDMD